MDLLDESLHSWNNLFIRHRLNAVDVSLATFQGQVPNRRRDEPICNRLRIYVDRMTSSQSFFHFRGSFRLNPVDLCGWFDRFYRDRDSRYETTPADWNDNRVHLEKLFSFWGLFPPHPRSSWGMFCPFFPQ